MVGNLNIIIKKYFIGKLAKKIDYRGVYFLRGGETPIIWGIEDYVLL